MENEKELIKKELTKKEIIEKRINELLAIQNDQQMKINDLQNQIGILNNNLNQIVSNWNFTRGSINEKQIELLLILKDEEFEKRIGDQNKKTLEKKE